MEIVGCHEAAQIAGISRQRFHFMYQHGQVPAPVARLRCGTVWDGAVIREWAAARNRASGRPMIVTTAPKVG